jgi:hypothetical protein
MAMLKNINTANIVQMTIFFQRSVVNRRKNSPSETLSASKART